jgi:hypothetical protein
MAAAVEAAVPGLEITREQRAKGLRDPLRPEQVDYFMDQWKSSMGAFCPITRQDIQEVAAELLPMGAGKEEIADRLIDLA